MKKSFLALLAIVAFSFVSCDDPPPVTQNPTPPGGGSSCTVVLPDGTVYTGDCDAIEAAIRDYESPSIQPPF